MFKSKFFLIGFFVSIFLLIGSKSLLLKKTNISSSKETTMITLKELGFLSFQNNLKALFVKIYQKDKKDFIRKPLKDYQGKILILHFWAPWCGPCNKEFPYYLKFTEENPIFYHLAIASPNVSPEVIEAYYKKNNVKNLDIIFPDDSSPNLSEFLSVPGIPTTIFIDKESSEIGRIVGPIDWENQGVRQIIKEKLNHSS